MWPGPRQVGRPRARIDRGEHRRRAIARRNAGAGDRPSPRSTRRTPCRTARCSVGDHLRQVELVEPLLGHRHADQAAAVLRHEVDRLGRDLLGRDRQVAFVLAILVVDDDDHLAVADRLDGVLDRCKRRLLPRPRGFLMFPAFAPPSTAPALRQPRLDARAPRTYPEYRDSRFRVAGSRARAGSYAPT